MTRTTIPTRLSARVPRHALLLATVMLVASACAIQKSSEPASIPISVAFPSTAAAALTDTVKVYVFDSSQSCDNLIALRQTGQKLPATVQETAGLTPCQLLNNQGNTLELPIHSDYSFLAVGQIAGNDVFIGCTVESAYGTTQALSVPLSFINDQQKLNSTNCTKLSDKCRGACQ